MARYRRGEREQAWREVIRDHAASGLSISAFCRDREVSPASFFSWRRKLADREFDREAECEAATPHALAAHHTQATEYAGLASKFVALDLPLSKEAVSPVAVTGAGLQGTSRMESPADPRTVSRTGCEIVLPNGCRVIVPVQCDTGWLREILAAVRDTAGLVRDTPEVEQSC